MTRLTAFALLMVTLAEPSSAALGPWLPEYQKVTAPEGYRRLCMFRPDACDGGDGAGRVAKVTPSLISELQSFNQKMNFAISYRPDPEIFGEPDIWTIAVAAGDCEDIALAKREALLRAGWPADALWLAIGQTPSGASHAVLVLRSDRGDLVLDNRSDRVEFWYRSDLRFLARQMPGDRLYWRRLRSAH